MHAWLTQQRPTQTPSLGPAYIMLDAQHTCNHAYTIQQATMQHVHGSTQHGMSARHPTGRPHAKSKLSHQDLGPGLAQSNTSLATLLMPDAHTPVKYGYSTFPRSILRCLSQVPEVPRGTDSPPVHVDWLAVGLYRVHNTSPSDNKKRVCHLAC
jgi:hypothetical protein